MDLPIGAVNLKKIFGCLIVKGFCEGEYTVLEGVHGDPTERVQRECTSGEGRTVSGHMTFKRHLLVNESEAF